MKQLILSLGHYVSYTFRPSTFGSPANSVHKSRSRFAVLAAWVVLALLKFGFDAQAANTADNYTGSSTESLLTPGNWSLGSVPTVVNDAIFTATPGTRTIGAGSTVGNLTVGSFDVTASSG